jgi:hypothetical protein
MRLLEKPRLLVMSKEEFEACRPFLRAAGFRWLQCLDGTRPRWEHQWWSPTRSRWVSDRGLGDEEYVLELECLPHVLEVSNARDFLHMLGAQTP